mgnify:CR=1 FL=1
MDSGRATEMQDPKGTHLGQGEGKDKKHSGMLRSFAKEFDADFPEKQEKLDSKQDNEH